MSMINKEKLVEAMRDLTRDIWIPEDDWLEIEKCINDQPEYFVPEQEYSNCIDADKQLKQIAHELKDINKHLARIGARI